MQAQPAALDASLDEADRRVNGPRQPAVSDPIDPRWPDRSEVEALRERYEGQRVVLVRTTDPYTDLAPGTEGTVTLVDDAGTAHVAWDSGHTLGMVLSEDAIRRI